MAIIDDIRAERMKKLELLKEAGMDPYPIETNRTHDGAAFLASFKDLKSSQEKVTLAGRVMSLRAQGGIVFADVFDGTERVQILIKKDDVGDDVFELFVNAVDASDFIEVTGTAFTTKREVSSLSTASWRMLAKSMRPVPDEWFGLKDDDERYRRRYLDILLDPKVADLVRKRSVFWNSIRSFMLERNFVEVETPVLEVRPSGARARQFIAHHNALNTDVYLRISPEIWHKRLMIAGLPKVFEIGRVFRNEGISYEHAQDYTVFESYESYQDSREGLLNVIKLLRYAAESTFGTLKFKINGFNVDLSDTWKVLDFNTLMKQAYDLDPRNCTPDDVTQALQTIKDAPESESVEKGMGLLWNKVREEIGGPAILTAMPLFMAPLGKKSQNDSRVVDEFKLIIGGNEIGHCFNELNDSTDQKNRFTEQKNEISLANQDFIDDLEYGMPPTFGLGVSERFFSFLADVSIREAQSFPIMKPAKNS